MQGDERLRLLESVEDVEIEKRFDDEEFPFPSIVYEITSGREETVTLRIVDAIPPGVDVGNIGFHRAFGGEHWSIDDDRLVYESELDPGASAKTVYALSATGAADPDVLFAEPASIEVEPPVEQPDEWTTPPTATDGRGVDGPTGNGADPEPAGSGAAVESLARELESGAYEDSDLETIVAAVAGANGAGSGPVQARLSSLEDDITELRAYTGALQTLLDGTNPDTLVSLPERIAAVESDLESLRTDIEGDGELAAEVDSLSETVASLESTLRTVEGRLDDTESFLDEIRAALS